VTRDASEGNSFDLSNMHSKPNTQNMKNLVVGVIALLACSFSQAQVAENVKASPGKKMGEFSDWTPVEFSLETNKPIMPGEKVDDKSKATIEYRIALADRKGIGCHYDVEIKNTSNITLSVAAEILYFDKLVKRNMSDARGEDKLKAGKSVVLRLIAQGCKKDKGSDLDDYASCLACEFNATIVAGKVK
jgi:hypothetical protein